MSTAEIMSITLNVLGGLAIFIFGMRLMSTGLQQVAGARMRTILHFFSANRFMAIFSGAAVTSVVQSSSATTVMVIGFLNAGLLTLTQAIGIIFGAHIGSTVTAQLIAFDIKWLIMPSIIVGLTMGFAKKRSLISWGSTILGFGFLFFGMRFMSMELSGLSNYQAFRDAFRLFWCEPDAAGFIALKPMLGAIAIGIVATMIIQSSAACAGIVIALGATGLLNIYTAIAIVLGSNIGTTVTAQLAAISANRVAKQAALAHTLSNVIGVALALASFLIVYENEPIFVWVTRWVSGANSDLPRQIANAHTIFNVGTTVLLTPFIPLFALLCNKLIPIREHRVRYQRLEPHLLNTPSIALAQTTSALRRMLKKSWQNVDAVLKIYNKNNEKNKNILANLEERENDIDVRQQDITSYLAKLMLRPLSAQEAAQIPLLLHCTNDAERIGDYAEDIKSIMDRITENKYKFSPKATGEFNKLHETLDELTNAAIELLANKSPESIMAAISLKYKLSDQIEKVESSHMARVNKGTCLPEVSILFLELLEVIRKVTRHVFNIIERTEMIYERIPQVNSEDKKKTLSAKSKKTGRR